MMAAHHFIQYQIMIKIGESTHAKHRRWIWETEEMSKQNCFINGISLGKRRSRREQMFGKYVSILCEQLNSEEARSLCHNSHQDGFDTKIQELNSNDDNIYQPESRFNSYLYLVINLTLSGIGVENVEQTTKIRTNFAKSWHTLAVGWNAPW